MILSFCNRRSIFQYPLSDRAFCNSSLLAMPNVPPSTFSILSRIERSATSALSAPSVAMTHFQYPLSDRAFCNTSITLPASVVSRTFSILSRIERSATSGHERPTHPENHFQYPLSDRAFCNDGPIEARDGERRLSVSSLGSSVLQHRGRYARAHRHTSFQYPLSRVGRDNPRVPVFRNMIGTRFRFHSPKRNPVRTGFCLIGTCSAPGSDQIPFERNILDLGFRLSGTLPWLPRGQNQHLKSRFSAWEGPVLLGFPLSCRVSLAPTSASATASQSGYVFSCDGIPASDSTHKPTLTRQYVQSLGSLTVTTSLDTPCQHFSSGLANVHTLLRFHRLKVQRDQAYLIRWRV
jgi:hypothetical protein